MKIAISGAQSTGKTTLINELKKNYQFTFKTEITRELAAKGYLINELGTDETQLAIMNSHKERLQIEEDVVYDRCALDGVVYTHYLFLHNKVSKETLDITVKMFKDMINQYDIIFYIEPEFEIEDDGQRSNSKEFRDEIVLLFDKYISEYSISIQKLTGTVAERVIQFQNALEETLI